MGGGKIAPNFGCVEPIIPKFNALRERPLRATPSMEAPVRARVYYAQSGALAREVALAPEGDAYVARTILPPGAYRAKVTAEFPGNPVTVTEAFLTVS